MNPGSEASLQIKPAASNLEIMKNWTARAHEQSEGVFELFLNTVRMLLQKLSSNCEKITL